MSYVCRDLVSFITPADLAEAARDVPAMASRYLDRTSTSRTAT